jgi:hypothetical protein
MAEARLTGQYFGFSTLKMRLFTGLTETRAVTLV